MANVSRPAGLSPVGYLSGAKWNGQARTYCIPSTDSTYAYAIGDPVALAGGASSLGVATVTLATAGTGNAIIGSIVGVMGDKYGGSVYFADLTTTVIPVTKATDRYVMVADDPSIIFEIQEDGDSNYLAATDVGNNINLVSGTNNGYVSGWLLDSSSCATTATLQCKLLGLAQRTDNAIGQYAKWLVLINNHSYRGGAAGV